MPANGSGYRVARKKKLTHFVLYALTSLMKLRHTKLRRTKVRQFLGPPCRYQQKTTVKQKETITNLKKMRNNADFLNKKNTNH